MISSAGAVECFPVWVLSSGRADGSLCAGRRNSDKKGRLTGCLSLKYMRSAASLHAKCSELTCEVQRTCMWTAACMCAECDPCVQGKATQAESSMHEVLSTIRLCRVDPGPLCRVLWYLKNIRTVECTSMSSCGLCTERNMQTRIRKIR